MNANRIEMSSEQRKESAPRRVVRFCPEVEVRQFDAGDPTVSSTKKDDTSTSRRTCSYFDLPLELRIQFLAYCVSHDVKLEMGRQGPEDGLYKKAELSLKIIFPKYLVQLMLINKQSFSDVLAAFNPKHKTWELRLQDKERYLRCSESARVVHRNIYADNFALGCTVRKLRLTRLPRTINLTHLCQSAVSHLVYLLPHLREIVIDTPFDPARNLRKFTKYLGDASIHDVVSGRADKALLKIGERLFADELEERFGTLNAGRLVWEFKISVPFLWLGPPRRRSHLSVAQMIPYGYKDFEYTCSFFSTSKKTVRELSNKILYRRDGCETGAKDKDDRRCSAEKGCIGVEANMEALQHLYDAKNMNKEWQNWRGEGGKRRYAFLKRSRRATF